VNKFSDGTRVKVATRSVETHIRAPAYIQGKTGVVERMCGSFHNPENLAYGNDGLPKQLLYRVRFFQADVWTDYVGKSHDTIDVEVYHHWLALEAQK
jgi:hypothetical protein